MSPEKNIKQEHKTQNSLFWTQNNLFTKVNKHKIECLKEEKKRRNFRKWRDKKELKVTNTEDNQRWNIWVIEVPKEENRPNTTSYMIQENSSEIECVKLFIEKDIWLSTNINYGW